MVKELERLKKEMGKFCLLFALSRHRELADRFRPGKEWRNVDVESLKRGILREEVSPGDRVEGRGVISPYAAVYHPRPFYPQYVLGEIRAAMQRGEGSPEVSPHFLPASRLPALPGGWRIAFLYPVDTEALVRPAVPADVREVLVRHYPVLPVLVPPELGSPWGRASFRARVFRLEHEQLRESLGMGEEAYRAYSRRGVIHFLVLEELSAVEEADLRGSLFLELSVPRDALEGLSGEGFRDLFCSAVEECLGEERQVREPSCGYLPLTGYQELRFRSRMTGVVDSPFYGVFRAPASVGLYIPCELVRREWEGDGLLGELLRAMERRSGLADSRGGWKVEFCFDNTLPHWRGRGALEGPLFDRLENEWPEARTLLSWLRGEG